MAKRSAGRKADERLKMIPLDMINEPVRAVRLAMDRKKLDELKKSIERVGLINPVTVVPVGEKYEIETGHRRFIAHRELHRPSILCRVVSRSAKEIAVTRVMENISREDITDWEVSIQIEGLATDYLLSQKDISELLGRSEAYVSQRRQLITAPAIIQEAVRDGVLSFSVARELMGISDESELDRLVPYAVQNGVTPAVARQWRMQWESAARDGLGGGAEAPAGAGEQYEPMNLQFKCEGCGASCELSEMRILRLCTRCLADVKRTA